MRYFWKVFQAQINATLMVHIKAAEMPSDAKRLALGIMQITNSQALLHCDLIWLPHDQKALFNKARDGDQNYVAVLSGQIMCMVGDECPPMNAGDVFWIDSTDDAIVLNKSGDDAIVLFVTVKPE